MSEALLTPPSDFNELARNYRNNLNNFRESTRLPADLFNEPDYAMIKAEDTADFAAKVRKIKKWTREDQVAFLELGGRFLAVAELAVPYPLADSKYFNLIEIMEPKYVDFKGMEYASFYHPDLNSADKILNNKNIVSEWYFDRELNWRWLSIPINDEGQELRFSDTKLLEVLEQELEDGTARII